MLTASLIAGLLAVTAIFGAVPASGDNCGAATVYFGCPSASSSGDQVQAAMERVEQHPGYREVASPIVGAGSDAPGINWRPTTPPPPEDRMTGDWTCYDGDLDSEGSACVEFPTAPAPDTPAEPEGPVIPDVVTVSDIASFVPAAPSVATEPDGIAAKNMPLNTIAASQPHTVTGSLFDVPVSVTFTPAGFRQDWGDGTVTESGTGGAAWATLGQAEYTPTPTSHAYAAKGTYLLTVTALYTAVVDFGPFGTRAVDGVVSAPGATREIRVVEVHTALVQSDCTENPDAAGCS